MFVQKDQLFALFKNITWEHPTVGIRRKVMAYGETVMAVYVEFQKGAVGILHSHPHTQISFIHSGCFEVQIDGKKELQNTGDCFFVSANAEHGVVALEDGVLVDFFTPIREDFIVSQYGE